MLSVANLQVDKCQWGVNTHGGMAHGRGIYARSNLRRKHDKETSAVGGAGAGRAELEIIKVGSL